MKWRALLTALLFAAGAAQAQNGGDMTQAQKAITQPAQWLNTARPLTAEDLQGRIILLDFWTFCCINCMHVIPDLHYLEHTFGDKLTVIGVHSAKFANEKDSANIRAAIVRYGIEHPVVNDSTFQVWNAFGVHSWPTFVLISPQGRVVSEYAGEGNRAALEKDIAALIAKNPQAVTAPLPLALEKNKAPQTALEFPGKVIYVPEMNALAISDSGHNRIVIAGLDGQIRQVIGSGAAGLKDGDFAAAQFRSPQGMAYKDGILYVADTENHALRAVDFARRRVMTLAGTGQQGYVRDAEASPALKTPLASPWDVAFYPDEAHLAIAMAGTHQLWSYDLGAKTVSVIAGSGREDIADGAARKAALAQTSGLSSHGGKLYFVDAETSSLRVYDGKTVQTLIGSGLFDFGYKDGRQGKALLQHPLGLYADDSGITIADSYNHSIRRYDGKTGVLSTLAGHGVRGNKNGALTEAEFNEPNAITRVGDVLYVADTNNQAIRTIDVKKGIVGTLDVRAAEKAPAISDALPNLQKLGVVQLAPQAEIRLALNPGWHINAEAPSYLALYKGAEAVKLFSRVELAAGSVTLPPLEAGAQYRLQGTFYYCKEQAGSQCLIKSVDGRLKQESGGENAITLTLK